MPKAEKLETVAGYKKLFEESESFFVTDFKGLNVADLTVLRKNLRENKIKYLVGKNTLFRIAAGEAKIDGIEQHLEGPTAIAFTDDDPAVTAKILYDSYKDKELPRMKAFWLDNIPFDGLEIRKLAELPPKEVLYSNIVAAVEAPMTQLVGSLDGFFRELVGSIEALAEQKEGKE